MDHTLVNKQQEYPNTISEGCLKNLIGSFLQNYQKVWWDCHESRPIFDHTFSNQVQKNNDGSLEKITDILLRHCQNIPESESKRRLWKQQLLGAVKKPAVEVFNLKPEHIEFIETSGILEAIEDFCRKARNFDAGITEEDLFQAGRNIVTANLIQVLLGEPVRVTPSLFAYSMLYPYTDNYLDDPTITDEERNSFNKRFLRRLEGETINAFGQNEDAISDLIGMIESEWDRKEYPQVYESLLAIYHAQCRSLKLVKADLAPYERDILGISFLKGGTSVLADGFLVAGSLTNEQAKALFGFGAFTQLMDDLEDIKDDLGSNRASLFTITSRYWRLDDLFNRFCWFGKRVIGDLNAFHGEDVSLIADLMRTCIDPMLLNTVAQSSKYFSPDRLMELETHMPVSFTGVNRQKKKLSRYKLDTGTIMEVFLL